MNNKKKVATLLTLLASTTLVIGTVVAIQTKPFSNLMSFSEGDTKVTLDGSHGNVSDAVQLLKTSTVTAKTFKGNDVDFDYKNVQAVSNKVGKILAGGFYRNRSPLHDMQSIRVVSNAATGAAKIYYGKASAYMTDYIDLQAASSGAAISGNFFKIVADSPVEIDSIEIGFGCETKDYGPTAYNSTEGVLDSAYKFVYSSGHYEMKRNSGYVSSYKVIVPDYFNGSEGDLPVTVLQQEYSCGTFEGSTSLRELYLPETITTFGPYLFYSNDYPITEFSMPLELTQINSNPLPRKNLVTLNIHSRNAAGNSQYIDSSNFPKLETINVSYDVAVLPNIVSSWPSSAQTINYEGTTAEWATLVAASASTWTSFPGDVICSDTTMASVTLHFTGATLGDDSDVATVTKASGKSVSSFGTPVYAGGTKKFVGWFDAAEGGNQITFPYTFTSDTDIYAHFEDYGAGISFANPIIASVGQTYNYATDSQYTKAYFQYTATSDEVLTVKVTSAAAAFGDNVYFHVYDDSQAAITVNSGNSASNEMNKVSIPTSYGVNVPLKVRLAQDETVYIVVDGNDNASRVGDLSVSFDLAAAGTDYTNANIYNSGDAVATLPRYGLVWYKFVPETTGTYMFNGNAANWVGCSLGHIDAGAFVSDTASASALNISSAPKRALVSLTAGVEYYFVFSTNTANTEVTFSVSDELDPGIGKSSAISVSVDGAAVTVPYSSDFPQVWYKFDASIAGKFRLVVDDDTTIYTSGSSYPLFAAEDAAGTAITIDEGRTAHDKVIEVSAAGTYYVAITTSSTAKNFEFSVESIGVEYTVTVYADGPGTTATSSQKVDEGDAYVLADPVYNSNGFTYYSGFDGWYTDTSFTQPFTSGDVINADTNIYAKLDGEYQSDLFNELYNANSTLIEFGEMSSTDYHFVKDGSDIVSTNGINGTAGQKSSYSTMSVIAKKNISVSFDYLVSSESTDKFYVYTRPNVGSSRTTVVTQGGTSQTSAISKSISLATGGVVEFVYYKDSSVDSGNDKVTISNLVFAEITPVTLTYNFQDDVTDDQEVEVLPGVSITKIADPTRSGYRFDGWYTEPAGAGSAFVFTNGITVDTTIYAKWVQQVTITVYADGPSMPSTATVVKDIGSTYSPSTPAGDTFEGWYTDSACTDPFDSSAAITADISIYAKFNGKYKMQVFNDIDEAFPDAFSNIDGTTNSYHFNFDKTTKVFTSGNKGAGGTTSELVLTLSTALSVSFDYSIDSESGWDIGTVVVGGVTVVNESGEKSGSYSSASDLPAGTIIRIKYVKDGSGDTGDDVFTISNLTFSLSI